MKINQATPTSKQWEVIRSPAKRKVIRAGRRGGKTIVAGVISLERMLQSRRVLYATPTSDQLQSWWDYVSQASGEAIQGGGVDQNKSRHIIEPPNPKIRVRGKTAWNSDTMRGDYADVLILDEVQLMDPGAWEDVGAPMLIDNDGDAIFIYTPPKPTEKAPGYDMCKKMFDRGESEGWPEWDSFHWTSEDNPHVSKTAIERMKRDMTADSYQREILAEDTDEVPDALWTRELVNSTRVDVAPESMERIAIGVDPPGGATECGIVAVGRCDGEIYIIEDASLKDSPDRWGSEVVSLAARVGADIICAEKNFGGDMVESVLKPIIGNRNVRYKNVNAARGKAVRAEPVVAAFERGEGHIVGGMSELEKELCTWVPGSNMDSPNRLDAMVWAATELKTSQPAKMEVW